MLQPSSKNSTRKVSVDEVYSWANELAAESRLDLSQFYVHPKAFDQIYEQLRRTEGCLIGVVGPQGVGKSSLLRILQSIERLPLEYNDVALFKWQRERNLFESLLEGDHEVSREFLQKYKENLIETYGDRSWDPSGAKEEYPEIVPIRSVERRIGQIASEILRRKTWLDVLRSKKIILIDTPDYSKTDKRAMSKDLNEIYWLWVNLSKTKGHKPSIVLAVQKEMFGGHFFFDKMKKFEIEPLQPRQLLEAYTRRFKKKEPFTEDALLTLALMSRGIFRRFLRYISLTLELWLTYPEPRQPIDQTVVKEAVRIERVTEDMELELAEVFPRQSDSPRQAVRILMALEESGALKQSELVERLGIEDYAMSRLLSKLELHRYVRRERSGTDKIVTLART